MSFDEYFATVRKACLPAVWSDGVTVARGGAVLREKVKPDELTYRVRASGHAVDLTVTLYVLDGEWSCNCGGHADPCAHVAAATIATKQAELLGEAGAAAPAPELARLVYAFTMRDERLFLKRSIRQPGGAETALVGLLSSAMAQKKLPANLAPTQADLKVDRITEGRAELRVPLHELAGMFDALAPSEHVTLDGVAVKVAGETLQPHATVSDSAGGFTVRIESPPELERVVARGVGVAGGVLRPLGALETAGESYERLPLTRTYAAKDAGMVAQKIVPELEASMADVVIRSKRLPRRTRDAMPRLDFEITHADGILFVLPRIVYGDPAVARVEGERLVTLGNEAPKRRPQQESQLVLALREDLNLVPGRRVDFRGAESARFLGALRTFVERRDENGRLPELAAGPPLLARIQVEDASGEPTLEVWFESENGAKKADASTVLSAWRAGLDLVPLLDGGFAPLPAGWLDKHGARVAELLAARNDKREVPRVLAPELAALCTDSDVAPPPSLAALLSAFTFDAQGALAPAQLPADLHADLREYQHHGVSWLVGLRQAELGGILADDMGLGKTLQTLAALQGRCLVVCPKSVVFNWASEIAKFRPGLRAVVHERGALPAASDADVVLTTYARLRIDADLFAKEGWDAVVLDEAQAIKNQDSQTARAAFRLNAVFRIALSGTPVENRLEELWSLSRFANPGLLGELGTFRDRFAVPIANGKDGAAAALRARIRPFLLRRTKREVLKELPARTETREIVQLDESERATYDAVLAATRKEVAAKLGEGNSTLAILEALLRLRQAACHQGLLPGREETTSSKVERLVEILEELSAEGHKALVFSQWTGLLDKVEPHLQRAAIRFTRLDGSTKDREAVVREFQDDAGPPVLLLSLKAGGTGLNLTAADHVFLLDPWWNPAAEDQAADRAHRIGQTRPVLVHRLVAKDTVEEKILLLQQRKRTLADAALGDGAAGQAVTRDELLELLE